MTKLPEEVRTAWDNREGPLVLSTVSRDGTPNSIYATCASRYADDTLLVANNYFSKTMENIKSGSKASILFITKEKKSYQVKGHVEYSTEGLLFDDMKTWNPEKHPGHGVLALKAEEVYSGAKKLL